MFVSHPGMAFFYGNQNGLEKKALSYCPSCLVTQVKGLKHILSLAMKNKQEEAKASEYVKIDVEWQG